MSLKFAPWVGAAALLLLPQWCPAQERERQQNAGGLFERLDANKDGQITADEVSEDRKAFFERMVRVNDKNGDGKLSKEEFDQGTRPGERPNRPAEGRPGDVPDLAALFKRFDSNADGKIVPDEVPEERRAQFKENMARADRDNDGAISLDEFRGAFAQLLRRPGDQPGQPTQPGRPGLPPGPDGRPNLANAPFFRAIDTNGDGKISAEELTGAAAALKKLDRNEDGFLTPEELIPPGPPAGEGRPGAPGRPGQGAPGANVLGERLRQLDTNGDGKVSKDEAPERMKENFDRLDTNKDGFLDAAEMQRMFDRARGAVDQLRQRRPGAAEPPKESDK